MKKNLREVSVADIYHAFGEKDEQDIPSPCQKRYVCSKDIHTVQNESVSWLKKTANGLPIWSRLNENNCMGQCRENEMFKMKNYEMEIPGRLFSMFGSHQEQTQEFIKMSGLENFQLVACTMALCSALKYDLLEWSPKLLDNIITQAAKTYVDMLRKLNILDRHFSMASLNQVLRFQGIDYQVTAQQVATGFMYIPYGYNEFNLARALYWFFHHYQFGIIQCCNRSVAFGFTLNSPYGFFMYDCQTRGPPLFKDQQYNSYILRSNHLQILLYCMTVTLNITLDRVKFFMYSVDVRIINPLELKKLKKELYVPTIAGTDIKNMVVEKKVDCGTDYKKVNNVEQILINSNVELNTKQTAAAKDIKNMKKVIVQHNPGQQTITVAPTQVIGTPYKLNQKRMDKEVIKNNRTTIRKAHRIFNAIIPKYSKTAQKPNTNNVAAPAAAKTAAVKTAPVNTPKPPKVTLEKRSLPNLNVERPKAPVAQKPPAAKAAVVQANSTAQKPPVTKAALAQANSNVKKPPVTKAPVAQTNSTTEKPSATKAAPLTQSNSNMQKPAAVNIIINSGAKNPIDSKPISPGHNTKLDEKFSHEETVTNGKSLSFEKPPPSPSQTTLTTKKIRIDPKKKYYIVALPKENIVQNPSIKKTNEKSILKTTQHKATPAPAPAPAQEQVKVNIQRVTTVTPSPNEDNCRTYNVVRTESMDLDLHRTDSERTLTNVDGILNPTGLKIFLVNNSKKCGL